MPDFLNIDCKITLEIMFYIIIRLKIYCTRYRISNDELYSKLPSGLNTGKMLPI